jgi:hypothetical protein
VQVAAPHMPRFGAFWPQQATPPPRSRAQAWYGPALMAAAARPAAPPPPRSGRKGRAGGEGGAAWKGPRLSLPLRGGRSAPVPAAPRRKVRACPCRSAAPEQPRRIRGAARAATGAARLAASGPSRPSRPGPARTPGARAATGVARLAASGCDPTYQGERRSGSELQPSRPCPARTRRPGRRLGPGARGGAAPRRRWSSPPHAPPRARLGMLARPAALTRAAE